MSHELARQVERLELEVKGLSANVNDLREEVNSLTLAIGGLHSRVLNLEADDTTIDPEDARDPVDVRLRLPPELRGRRPLPGGGAGGAAPRPYSG